MLHVSGAIVQTVIDPLSDVFSLTDMRSARCTRLEAGGGWALSFPAKAALKFVAVLRGRCWLTLPGEAPHRLGQGDTFLLANAPAYVIASDLDLAPEDGVPLFDGPHLDVARYNGDDTALLGGAFVFDSGGAQLLLDALPPFIHIPASEPAAAVLRGTLELLDAELQAAQMGASLMARRLGDVLLVQALRVFAARQGRDRAGWVVALADPKIGGALNLIHKDPGRRWTVDELASAIGMSRSGFALRFKELVGLAPLDYLTRWRMQLAREALRRKEASVASLAATLGYASESAFGNAFKRIFGRSPKRYWISERTA